MNKMISIKILLYSTLLFINSNSQNWRQQRRDHFENYSNREQLIKETGDLGKTPSAILIVKPKHEEGDKILSVMYLKVKDMLPEISPYYNLIDSTVSIPLNGTFNNPHDTLIEQLDSELISNASFEKFKYIAIFYGMSTEYKENEVATRAMRWMQQRGDPDKPYYANFLSLSFSVYSRDNGKIAFHSRLTENHKQIETAAEEVIEELLEEFEQAYSD